MKRPKLSIGRRLALLNTGLAGIPLALLGVGAVLATQAYLQRQAHLTLVGELTRLEEEIQSLFGKLRGDALVLETFVRKATPQHYTEVLRTFASARPFYGSVFLIAGDGRRIAHVDRLPWQSRDSPYYGALAHDMEPDSAAVLPVELLAGESGNLVRPTLAVVAPVRGPAGAGVALVLEMDADSLFGIFRTATGPLGGALAVMFGDGYYLFNSARTERARSLLAPEAPGQRSDFSPADLERLLSGRAGELTAGDRLVLYRSVGRGGPHPEDRLIAYREVSRRALIAPARRVGWLVAGGLAVILALALGLSTASARHFTRPIVRLRDATRALARGGSEVPLIQTNDELEELARDFATMADEVRERQASLQRSEAGYRSLVESAPYGIFRATRDGKLLAVNPALVTMLRYADETALLAADLAGGIHVRPAEWRALASKVCEAGQVDGVELEWRRRDGRVITVRLSGRAVRDEQPGSDRLELAAEDITERRALEHQLRQAQKMEALGQLGGGMAHDFNNLLTTILASAQMVEAELPPESPLREDLDAVRLAAERGAALIRKLLAFTRKQRLEFRTVRLGELVDEFTRVLRRVVREDIEIRVEHDAEPAVRADPSTLEQILLNLVTNARDAMPQGGTIAIRTGHALLDAGFQATHGWGTLGEYALLAVSDDGTGMDAETQRRIFEPFFTTKPVGAGTGLGMAIVYGLVKQQGGYVDVESRLDEGTTVTVYFPAVPKTAEAPPPDVPRRQVHRGTETILLVEDEEALRSTGRRVLEKHGYSVVEACDGVEALQVLEQRGKEITLIVCDVVMPRLGGAQLYEELRRTGRTVKVLFTSGYTDRDVRDEVRLDPSLPFLPKPWSLEDLLTRVREVLDK